MQLVNLLSFGELKTIVNTALFDLFTLSSQAVWQ